MEQRQTRRKCLGQCAKCAGAGCALLAGSRLLAAQESGPAKPLAEKKPIDLKKLNYCGIPLAYCAQRRELYQATQENDPVSRKAVYDSWQMKAKFGIEFEPDKIFCYTCKPGDKPLKVGMAECPVRRCPITNGMESCIQCLNLAACDKEFWKTWPPSFASARMLQAQYKEQPGAVLIEAKIRI